jgi:hypothetical protein
MKITKTMRQYHVGVAAEAFAAGLFAQAGCDVLVQYGANQPLYDRINTLINAAFFSNFDSVAGKLTLYF